MSRPEAIWSAALVAALLAFTADASEIDAVDLYDLPAADVVFVGEVHDNPVHHAHQAILMVETGAAAVVFEMLTASQADRIDERLLRSEKAMGAILGWEASGWPDFSMYYPVFVAAREADFYGGAGSREAARDAVRAGAAAVFGEGAGLFGLDADLPAEERMLREAEQVAAHCNAIPEDLAGGMVEAQRLRDAWLAEAAIRAHAETGGPVVVITGNGHARKDWGAPYLVSLAAPGLSVLTIGQYELEAEAEPPFDHWLVTETVDRPDPCEIFRRN